MQETLSPPAIVQPADIQLARYIEIDSRVNGAEHDGIMARWEFGRELLKERAANGGKQLPHGRLGEVSEATGKSEREIHRRIQFAERWPTEGKVRHACRTFGSWHEIVNSALPQDTTQGMGGLKASTSVEWYTPEEYVEAAREVMGRIDLDPATCEMANEIVRAPQIFTERDNGLEHPWHGCVWLNPPYGKGSGLFTTKLIEEYDAGRVVSGILLINAYGFDSQWFQALWRFPLCFTDHRIEFYSPQRESGGPANANLFAYVGPDEERFRDTFSRFGNVVRRWE